MSLPEKVCTVIVNYNTWQFTTACVESLLVCAHPGHTIIVVDNASVNESAEKLSAFFGTLCSSMILESELSHTQEFRTNTATIVLIRSKANVGYAAGNNIGLRWGLRDPDHTFFWILNNDTLVAPDTLAQLIRYANRDENCNKGLIGSRLMYADAPEIIQAIGGYYNPWSGLSHHVADGEQNPDAAISLIDSITYVVGAACFLRRNLLENVGLMTEDYFLYFEDNDWSVRAERKGFPNGVCLASKVYHRDGGTTKADRRRWPSLVIEYYHARNKIRFTKRHYPYCTPTVLAGSVAAALARLLTGYPANALLILRVTLLELIWGNRPNYRGQQSG